MVADSIEAVLVVVVAAAVVVAVVVVVVSEGEAMFTRFATRASALAFNCSYWPLWRFMYALH